MICQAPAASGRFNVFQKVMLQWSELHPYNATHTYKLAGPLRLGDLCDAVRDTCLTHGIGLVQISPDGQSYCHQADAAPHVQVVEGGEDPEGRLEAYVSRELNQPFSRPTCRPLRFGVIDAGPRFHYLSATYDHWVADSVAARLVLRSVLGRYLRLPLAENDSPLELYPATYGETFGHRLRGLDLAAAGARSLAQWNRNRKAWQMACWSSTQWSVGYELYHTLPGTVAGLRGFARSLGATVHDCILAALGRAMAAYMPSRFSRKGDRDLALGSIVDTRPAAEEDLSRTFGTFLAYYLVRCGADAHASLADTVRRIAAVTRPIKAKQRYLDSLVNMKFISTLWPWLSDAVKPHFMRKALPMTGGVSNVLLNEPWMAEHRNVILGYSRAAPTGPMLPLVLAPTTVGQQMNVGVTYRLASFPRAKIDGLMESVLEQLEHPDQPARRRRAAATQSPAGPARNAVGYARA